MRFCAKPSGPETCAIPPKQTEVGDTRNRHCGPEERVQKTVRVINRNGRCNIDKQNAQKRLLNLEG